MSHDPIIPNNLADISTPWFPLPPKLVHSIHERVNGGQVTAHIYVNSWPATHHFSAKLLVDGEFRESHDSDNYTTLVDLMCDRVDAVAVQIETAAVQSWVPGTWFQRVVMPSLQAAA